MNADQHIRKAISLSKKGETERALVLFRQVLVKYPSNKRAQNGINKLFAEADHNQVSNPPRAIIDEIIDCQKCGDFKLAITKSENSLESFPYSFFMWNLLGVLYKKTGEKKKSLDAYHNALLINPDYPEAYFNLGNSLFHQGLVEEAEKAFAKAAKLQPKNAKNFFNLAHVHNQQGNIKEAENDLKIAVKLNENYAEAFHLLAQIYCKKGAANLALSNFEKSIRSKPDYPEAYNNMSNVLWDLGRAEEAIEALERAVTLKPGLLGAASKKAYFLASKNICGTKRYLDEVNRLNRRIRENLGTPFVFEKNRPVYDRVRLGFVSGDFRDHPVGYFLESFIENLNRGKLDCLAFSNSPEETKLTQRIKPQFTEWHSIYGMRDADAASLIYHAKPDVLIDLSGHTGGNRLPVFALRPAPIQATWLGYFASTGIEAMDYIIGDKFVTPYDSQSEFTEKITQLPECYLCFSKPDMNIEVAPTPAIKNNNITFGCLNRADKVSKEVIGVWSQILKKVPNSKLLFRGGGYSIEICNGIINYFNSFGVEKTRLKFAEKTSREKFLVTYNQIDVALDPFPYPGGTSTCEALWMGVPVITKKGFNFLSRMGETILHNTGNGNLCAKNNEEYVSLAVELVKDVSFLSNSRAGRREQTLKSCIFDAESFAINFENMIFDLNKKNEN